MTHRWTVGLAAVFALVLVGCGTADTDEDAPQLGETTEEVAYSEECGQAFSEAAAVDDMQDTVEDLDRAFTACEDLEAFAAAAEDHADALDGTDVETWARERCESSDNPEVTDSVICEELTSG